MCIPFFTSNLIIVVSLDSGGLDGWLVMMMTACWRTTLMLLPCRYCCCCCYYYSRKPQNNKCTEKQEQNILTIYPWCRLYVCTVRCSTPLRSPHKPYNPAKIEDEWTWQDNWYGMSWYCMVRNIVCSVEGKPLTTKSIKHKKEDKTRILKYYRNKRKKIPNIFLFISLLYRQSFSKQLHRFRIEPTDTYTPTLAP